MSAAEHPEDEERPPDLATGYEQWLKENFGHVATKPLSDRHKRLWEWFQSLTPGEKPKARIEVWPRGGAKSSTTELGVPFIGSRLTRRFVLYVSETQDQADRHVQAIAGYFEQLGIERAVGRYGNSKGWRRDQVRTRTGFNVAALGLDVASRGIKLDQFRPDLIVFDDVDNENDSPKTIEKKVRAIKNSIIPAGSSDCAILFVQNLIHEDSIVATLVDGRADFLYNREVPGISKAVEGLKTEKYAKEDGSTGYRIVEGVPTWEGQNLAVCEEQINEWGLESFLRESQHEVQGAAGFYFDHEAFSTIKRLPPGVKLRLCRAWDLAATQGGGDWTVGVLMGMAPNGVVYILDVIREQAEPARVKELLLRTARRDARGEIWSHDVFDHRGRLLKAGELVGSFAEAMKGKVRVRLPQDPGQAGKAQALEHRGLLKGYEVVIKPVTGKKAVRARGYASRVNRGDARLLESDWIHAFKEEHRRFREDEDHDFDDQVDAASDAHQELAIGLKRKGAAKATGSRTAVRL